MRIGIYCGSFNPIHVGHTRLAEYILQHSDLDEVWLMVSPNNPLKQPGELLDERIRLHLARLATEAIPGVRCSDFEMTLPRPSYTIHTLQELDNTYPQHQFALIIGSDNMALFSHWKDYQLILSDYPIYVYPRQGDDMDELCTQYPTMQVIEGAPILPISATQLRQELRQGRYNQDWLHPAVIDFFKKNADLFADMKKKQYLCTHF